MRIKRWHWRDIMCWLKLHFSKDGYAVKELCGKCDKCNRLFAAAGCIPCPLRWDKVDAAQKTVEGIYERDFPWG